MSQVCQEFKPEKTITVSHSIRFNKDLVFGERIFLAEIVSLTKQGKGLNSSCRSLSKIFKVSHQTILNWIKKLIDLNLISAEYNPNIPNNKIVLRAIDLD